MIRGIDDPTEKLSIATRLYFRVVDQQKEKALLIYQKSNSLDRASKARVMQLEVEVSSIFREMIEEGVTLGVFRKVDVDLMAYNVMVAAHMWILKRWHFKNRLSLEKYSELQLSHILRSLKR
jgi:hypothetical protein